MSADKSSVRRAPICYCAGHVELPAGRHPAVRDPPRARGQAAPPRRRAARVAGLRGAEARGAARRDRRAGLRRHGADARGTSGDRGAAHDRPRLEAPRPDGAGARGTALLARLRARRYELLVHLTEHPRGADARAPAAPALRGHARARGRALAVAPSFTHLYRLPRQTPRHAVEANLDALRRIGVYPRPKTSGSCSCRAPASMRGSTRASRHALVPRHFVHVHPGSRWLFKCWPADEHGRALRSPRRRRPPARRHRRAR